MEADDPRAQAVFETIGAYFGYTMVLYAQFYDLDYVMLMGRVMSGKGGDTILRVTNEILAEEYPALAAKCNVTLPDEKMRRVGQAVAAASLPSLRK
jgi:predicted NBD/HSP70 family sugar kinase